MKEYFYEINLNKENENSGFISSPGLPDIPIVLNPGFPQNHNGSWTNDHLLAAMISACYMNFFLEQAEKIKLKINSYRSQCFVKLINNDNRYTTSEILLRPQIKLNSGANMLKAYKCVEEAERACFLKGKLKLGIEIHPQFEYSEVEKESINTKAS